MPIHHIIPRCLGGTDDPSNLIELTYDEHVEAHRLLALQYPTHSGIQYAYRMMINQTAEAHWHACSTGGKAGGKKGGRSTANGWVNGTIPFPGLLQPREVRVANGYKLHASKTSEDLSNAGKQGMKVTNKQRWKCADCEMTTSSGSLTSHQRSKGHNGRIRIM
jgi:hypothetical protein